MPEDSSLAQGWLAWYSKPVDKDYGRPKMADRVAGLTTRQVFSAAFGSEAPC